MKCQNAETTPRARRSFLERAIRSLETKIMSDNEVEVLWKLYNWKHIILLFWLDSRDQVRKALKFLYDDACLRGMFKAQNRSCTIAALGVSANSD
jgi:hypothetical protein